MRKFLLRGLIFLAAFVTTLVSVAQNHGPFDRLCTPRPGLDGVLTREPKQPPMSAEQKQAYLNSRQNSMIEVIPPGCTDLIVDGGFETGGIPSINWNPETSTNFGTPLCNVGSCGTGTGTAPPRTGAIWAWFGGIPAPETATLGQTVTIPAGTATLNFWMRIGSVSSPFTDVLNVRVDGAIVQTFTEPAVAEGAYTERTIDLTAYANGGAHTILFEYIGLTSGTANFVIDDVEIASCPCTPTSITLGASPAVCSGVTSAILPYTATTGTPDQYSIDYDAAAEAQGFVDVVNAALPASPITLTVPGGAVAATYNASITVRLAAGNCVSPAVPFTITINPIPTISSVTATPDFVCIGSTTQLNVVANIPPSYTVTPFVNYGAQANAGPTGDDANSGVINIGFPFTYFGTSYTQFGISTNGFIQLGAGPYTSPFVNQPIPNTATPNNYIALDWDDWIATAGNITYATVGVAPNRQLIVSFNGMNHFSGAGTGVLNGQIVLNETSNLIDIVNVNVTSTSLGTQGVENAGGTIGLAIAGRNNQNFSSSNESWRFSTNSNLNYSWTANPVAAQAGISNPAISNPIATVTVSAIYSIAVADAATGCSSSSSVTVTANPTPTVNAVADQAVCNGANTAAITFSGAVVGTVYNWTNNTPSIGLLASGSGDIASFVATMAGAVPVIATITVTPSYTNGGTTCTGTPITFTITVNPIPTVTAAPLSQTICSGTPITTIVPSGSPVSGTVYNWTRDNAVAVTGIAASGAGDIAGTLTNTTAAPVTVTFTITPTANGCPGAAITATVLVNPTPTVNPVANQVVCNTISTAPVTFTGAVAGTTFNWVNSNTSIGLAASGTGNIAAFTAINTTNAPVVGTVTVTPSTSTASGSIPELFHYKFDGSGTSVPNLASTPPTGTATATIQGTQTQGGSGICNGTLIGSGATSTTNFVNTNWATNLTGTSWTISFKTSNITPSTTLFYIFGDVGAASFRCFTNGVAGANNWLLRGPVSDVLIPGGATVAPHTTTFVYDNVAGNIRGYLDGVLVATVTQTAPTINGAGPFKVGGYAANTGLPTGGLMDEFRIYNRALNATEVGALTSCPAVTNICTGSPTTFTYTVNPTPTAVVTPTSQTVCSGFPITTIVPSGSAVSGTTYNWTRNNAVTVTGIAASGVGDIAGTLTNTTTNPITVTFTITPTANGCPGAAITATVLVNPTPVITFTPAAPVICNGQIQQITASVLPATPQTFSQAATTIIPLAGIATPYPTQISVAGLPTTGVTVKSVKLGNFNHTFPDDVDIVLVSPTGQSVILMSDAGGSVDVVGLDYTLDDAAATLMANSALNPQGTYRPTNYGAGDNWPAPGPLTAPTSTTLSTFSGNPNGDWKLYVVDAFGPDAGFIGNWSITFGIPTQVVFSPTTNLFTDPLATIQYTGTPTNVVYARPTVTTLYTATTTVFGCTGTGTVNVTVNQLPAITVQPTPATQTVCPGNNVTYSVTATGTGLTYQWRQGATNLVNSVQISGATTNTLTIANVNAANSGSYTCVVSGTCPPAVTTTPVVLNVATAPIISAQPANATVCAGQNASFTVASAGSIPPPTIYQWQVSTTGVAGPWVNLTTGGSYTATFTITGATTSQSGSLYRVLVTNICGQTTTSGNALLTVNALPTVTATALPARICISDTLVPLSGSPVGGSWSGIGVSGFNFVPSATAVGTYTLTYSFTNSLGCTNRATVTAKVEDCQERLRLLRDDALILYPNPNNGRFNIRINSTLYNYLGMKVYNVQGQLLNGVAVNDVLNSPVYSGLVYGRVIPIDLSKLPAGIYLVKFYYDDGVRTSEKTFKVVIGGH